MHSDLPLVEPIAIADIFVNGIADIEELDDGMLRVVLYAKRKNPHDHAFERHVVAALVMHHETFVRCMFQAAHRMKMSITVDVADLPREGDRLN